MKGDEGRVLHVSATSRRKKCPIHVNGLHEKKKKISFHALERFFHWSPRIEARTGVATRPHRSLTYRSFLNRYIGAHERSSDHKLCHNCHRKTNQISRYTQRHLIHLSRVI